MESKTYRIESRYLVKEQGWKTEAVEFTGTYEAAGSEASRYARALDDVYGGSHFWTVDLYSVEHPEYGSYCQLFHGRLS